MANLKADSPLSRRIVRSFLHFLNSVELLSGVDAEALDVAKDCLLEVFKIDNSLLDDQSSDSLVGIFGSLGGFTDNGTRKDVDMGKELPSVVDDELFGSFVNALEKISYFRSLTDGNDDHFQLDVATKLFHIAVKEMETSGCQCFDQKTLAETFKSQGNKAMQSKIYSDAVELYTFAIALSENNAVYYCNRAAAYTQVQDYTKAIEDCLRSIQINPNYSKAYSRLGFAYYAQGKYMDAIDKGFRRALLLDPDNESVKENIRVAEQKLKDEQQRAGSGQSSTSTRWRNSDVRTAFLNIPANSNGVSVDINSLFNITENAFQREAFPNGHDRGAREDSSPNDPEHGASGNASVREVPGEFSDALRSMMGRMFRGPTFDASQQPDDSTRRSNQ